MKLIGTPESDVCQKFTCDIYADAVSFCEVDNLGHPHGPLCCVREGPLNQFLHTFTISGISYQNHRFGLICLRVLAEGDLGVDEVEAFLRAVDRVVTLDQEAGVTALRVLPRLIVRSCR